MTYNLNYIYLRMYRVSPVEKLMDRATGALPVRTWCGHGTLMVRPRYARGAVEVHFQFCAVH